MPLLVITLKKGVVQHSEMSRSHKKPLACTPDMGEERDQFAEDISKRKVQDLESCFIRFNISES